MANKELIADQLIDDSERLLRVPEVAFRLGDHAEQLTETLHKVSYAGVNPSGYVELGANRSESVPLVVRHIGESAVIHADNSGMTVSQEHSLGVAMGATKAGSAARKLRDYFARSQSHRALPVFEDPKGLAVTSSNLWLPKPDTLVMGRPYVSMNADGGISGRLSPVVFLHELTHVLQKEKLPIVPTDQIARNKVKNELEGYYVAAQILEGMRDAGRLRDILAHSPRHEMDRARAVESVRRGSQKSSDPFDPNSRVVKALVDSNLGITDEIGAMISTKSS